MTRHEVDAPFNIGPVKVVPFAMGEPPTGARVSTASQ